MNFTLSFWGSQGRIGRITAGELTGRYIFVYPDTLPDWWTLIVEPSPYTYRDGEDYTHGYDLLESLLMPMKIQWLNHDESEVAIEREHFRRRPLLGPVDWLDQ